MNRIFGFEILPAPFVIAHLQLDLLLESYGATLNHKKKERGGIYLTNSLTGWEMRDQPDINWPELEEERKGSGKVKRVDPILVVIGNPPFDAFGGVSPKEEEGLVEIYKGIYWVPKKNKKTGKQVIGKDKKPKMERRYKLTDKISEGGYDIGKFNLDDLYVRFFRLAERRVAEKTGKGIVCYVSNYSYIEDPSFVIMRRRFIEEFDTIRIDSLNGDSRETGKRTPDGKPDPSAFSTKYNRKGIRLGTAVGIMVRKAERDPQSSVGFRNFWGVNKRTELLASLEEGSTAEKYEEANPSLQNGFSFRRTDISASYLSWPKIVDLCADEPISGLQEMRKGGLMAISRPDLESRMADYFDAKIDWATIKAIGKGLTVDGGRFEAAAARKKLLAKEKYSAGNIRRYALYPFDNRWCYYTATRPLWNEPRPDLVAQQWDGNSFIITRKAAERPGEQNIVTVSTALPDYHLLRPNAVAIPMRVRKVAPRKGSSLQQTLFADDDDDSPKANLSPEARAYLAKLKVGDVDESDEVAELIWMHSLAVTYSPAYLKENKDGIRLNWPRIPMPSKKSVLLASAEIGRAIASLLDPERSPEGVISPPVRPELKLLGLAKRVDGKEINIAAGDLNVAVDWGRGKPGGIVMPGPGKRVAREYSDGEKKQIEAGAAALKIGVPQVMALLGTKTCDVYLSEIAIWKNVPAKVWTYRVGGYPVLKKWLSYRDHRLLGRPLEKDESKEFTGMVRRIAALLLLQPSLDANYRAVTKAVYEWQ